MTFTDRLFGAVTLPFLLMVALLLTCVSFGVQWSLAYLVVGGCVVANFALVAVVAILLNGYYNYELDADAMLRAGAMFVIFLACYFPYLSLSNVTVIILPAVVMFIAAGIGIIAESRIRRRK